MYKNGLFILALLGFTLQYTESQTLDQILSRHFEASGQERFSKVSTVKSTGKALQMGMELPFIQIQQRPGKMYLEIDVQGMKMIQAFDGQNGWAVEPWMNTEPRELTGPELNNVGQMASIDSDLVDWENKGYKVKYAGKERLDDNEVFRLDLVKKDEQQYRFFIDSDSYLVTRIVTYTDYEGNIAEGETLLGDYRDIGGIKVPFRTELRYGGQILMINLIEKVEFDTVVGESFFTRP